MGSDFVPRGVKTSGKMKDLLEFNAEVLHFFDACQVSNDHHLLKHVEKVKLFEFVGCCGVDIFSGRNEFSIGRKDSAINFTH